LQESFNSHHFFFFLFRRRGFAAMALLFFKSSILQIHRTGFKTLLGSTVVTARVEKRRLVFLMAVCEESQRPTIFIAEIAQATQMGWRISQPLNMLLP